MLTINVDQHPLFKDHRPNVDERMVVILPEGPSGNWQIAGVAVMWDFGSLLRRPVGCCAGRQDRRRQS